MNAETIIGLVITSFVGIVMVSIGLFQTFQKDEPVGFYNVIDPPKPEEISDIIQWNKKHGWIWIIYGICIVLGFWLGFIMPNVVLQMIFMMGGILIPLPFMVISHNRLEREYKLEKNT